MRTSSPTAKSITIGMVDGLDFAGTVVGADTGFDVAVIKIDGPNLPTATLGETTNLQVGDAVARDRQPVRVRPHADDGRRLGVEPAVLAGRGKLQPADGPD